MSDSLWVQWSYAIAWLGTGLPVVPDRGGQGQEPLGDACVEAFGGAAAVAFQVELWAATMTSSAAGAAPTAAGARPVS
jgi:hypothetical protein